jgi:FkbM family methyltransferase
VQDHGEYIFHLDEPTEQPTRGAVPLRGWVVSHREFTELRLRGRADRRLQGEDRPDVRVAFPGFRFVYGFRDVAKSEDLRAAAFEFVLVGVDTNRTVVQPVAPPALRASLPVRVWSQTKRRLALARARVASEPRKRWFAQRTALLLEIKIARNGDFRREEGGRLLALFAECLPDAVVVQVGANDGATADPLGHLFAKSRWSGLLIEPVPYLAEALARRYRDRPGVRIEQVAISDRDGEAPLYTLRTVPGETPAWFNQLATLDRGVLLKHRSSIPEIESLIVEGRTPTARLDTLLMRHRLERVDLVVIDTEGHDFEVLRQVEFDRMQPLLVVFEHQHLAPADKSRAYDLLRANGFSYAETPEGDAFAWRVR